MESPGIDAARIEYPMNFKSIGQVVPEISTTDRYTNRLFYKNHYLDGHWGL